MKTKVTLSWDSKFVKEAKAFAKAENKSLSAVMKDSLADQIERKRNFKKRLEAHKRLAGSINLPEEDVNKTLDELRYEALKEKYDLP